MAEEEDDFDPDLDGAGGPEDHIAARAIAHTKELEAAAKLKEAGHEDLYKEAVLMAEALRHSFRTRKIGQLETIKGDKQETS